MRVTHTYAELEISLKAYNEIRRKLKAAAYNHAFEIGDKGDGPIDMHGLAVVPAKERKLRKSDFFGHWGKSDLVAVFFVAATALGVAIYFAVYNWAIRHGHH